MDEMLKQLSMVGISEKEAEELFQSLPSAVVIHFKHDFVDDTSSLEIRGTLVTLLPAVHEILVEILSAEPNKEIQMAIFDSLCDLVKEDIEQGITLTGKTEDKNAEM